MATTKRAKAAAVLVAQADMPGLLGVGRTTFFQLVKTDPTFPRPVYLPNVTRAFWLRADVEAWLKELAPKVGRN